jgi:hypothetical protein
MCVVWTVYPLNCMYVEQYCNRFSVPEVFIHPINSLFFFHLEYYYCAGRRLETLRSSFPAWVAIVVAVFVMDVPCWCC